MSYSLLILLLFLAILVLSSALWLVRDIIAGLNVDRACLQRIAPGTYASALSVEQLQELRTCIITEQKHHISLPHLPLWGSGFGNF